MLLIQLLLTAAAPATPFALPSQATRRGPGGSPTAAAEQMLGGTVRRGNSGFRVVRLSNRARGGDGCSSSAFGNLYEVTLYDTPNEWEEVFILGVPLFPEGTLSPLLMGFHQFEASERDFCLSTDFFDEALERGWYVVAPRGAVQYNFGYPQAQENTELVLDFCQAYLGHALDDGRIYGVGFSMGGTWMSSQAARHQDGSRPRFAALVNHTGAVDLEHTYDESFNDDNDPPFEIPDYLDALFGGSPLAFPFVYRQHSLIALISCAPLQSPGLAPFAWSALGAGSGCVDGDTDPGRNLLTIPMRLAYAAGDNSPAGVINRVEIDALFDHLTGTLAGTLTEFESLAGSTHNWSTLDPEQTCDYLAGKVLSDPVAEAVTTTSDRDARWFDMDVTQEAAGAFTRWTWRSDPDDVGNQWFALSATSNLDGLLLHCADAGYGTAVGDRDIKITLFLGAGDGTPDEIVLTGFDVEPSVDIAGSATPVFGEDYDFDPATGRLTLFRRAWPVSNLIDWIITP